MTITTSRAAVIALIGSVAVHASVYAGMPRNHPTALAAASPSTATSSETEVAVSNPDVPAPEPIAKVLAPTLSSPPHAMVRAVREATLPGVPGATPALSSSSPQEDAPSTPLRFVIDVGPARQRPAATTAEGVSERQGEVIYDEESVEAPPRLLAWRPPRYPQAAASAGVEVDVPVDVAIDTSGYVTDVHLPKHYGYGLDDAATAAAKSYRFSPGRKAGHPVRVHLRCTVMFRLN